MEVAVLVLLLQAAAEKETVSVPDTKVSFDLIRISGAPGLRPFSIGTREVTWADFTEFTRSAKKNVDGVTRPSDALILEVVGIPGEFLEPRRPVVSARWHTALAYCEWLSARTGRTFRLPTEKEWEAAARAGEAGNAPAAIDDLSWHLGNGGKRTHFGGEKKPNAFGLYDMLGNVWEYCLEFDKPPVYGPVLRGGSWNEPAAPFSARRTVPAEWFEADPNRPRSLWWLFGAPGEQGFRVVCVPDALGPAERLAQARQIPVRILGSVGENVGTGPSKDGFVRVKADVTNGTGQAIDELEIRVVYLDSQGKPHPVDRGAHEHVTYSHAWPVLASSADAAVSAPLKPGEKRTFEVFVPESYDREEDVDPWTMKGTVVSLRFAKE
jgi:hypothetical protein